MIYGFYHIDDGRHEQPTSLAQMDYFSVPTRHSMLFHTVMQEVMTNLCLFLKKGFLALISGNEGF